LLLECTAGFDRRDATSFDDEEKGVDQYSSLVKKIENANAITVGVPQEYNVAELSKEHRELWINSIQKMKEAGATIKQISLPHTKYALPAYYIISSAEASSKIFELITNLFFLTKTR
jgi:aspartyl-tRNA(Asn)/glutamyl-tRNA(Gln) amidotransferase subunit A